MNCVALWCMVVYGGLLGCMVVHVGELWCIVVLHCDSEFWWYMVVHGGGELR